MMVVRTKKYETNVGTVKRKTVGEIPAHHPDSERRNKDERRNAIQLV